MAAKGKPMDCARAGKPGGFSSMIGGPRICVLGAHTHTLLRCKTKDTAYSACPLTFPLLLCFPLPPWTTITHFACPPLHFPRLNIRSNKHSNHNKHTSCSNYNSYSNHSNFNNNNHISNNPIRLSSQALRPQRIAPPRYNISPLAT